MLFWKILDIADNEIVFVFRRERLEKVLGPGRHVVNRMGGKLRFECYDKTQIKFNRERAKFLLATYPELLNDYLEKFELTDKEVGLFYRDGHLVEVLAPGTLSIVWKGVEDVRVEVIDIGEHYELSQELVALLGRGVKSVSSKASYAVSYVEVVDEHVGLLSINGKFEKMLLPGAYGFWKYNRSTTVKQVDLRPQAVEVSGQEILTKDRVSLRINLAATYKLVDPMKVALKLGDYAGFIYRELQLSLREAVGTQALDTLLEAKDALNAVITDGVKDKLAHYGIDLLGVGVKDIILPGDMKMILNQVVEAQKEAEANVIKRREETQAMRSLHNTAKMMENNPILMRLKELEALERVTERIDKLTVFGGLNGVMTDLIKLDAD